MSFRLPRMFWIGVVLIFAGLGSSAWYNHWLETRRFIPLEMPVSLARGHIRTGDFEINLTGQYTVNIDVDYPFTYTHPECPIYGSDSVLKAHLTLFREGKTIGETDGNRYYYFSSFHANKKGRYSLDTEVLTDASCLNAAHPRLTVFTERYEYLTYGAVLQWGAFFCILAGLALVISPVAQRFYNPAESLNQQIADSTARPGYYHSRPRLRLKPRFAVLPAFGLIYLPMLFVTSSFFLVLGKGPSKGIWVSLVAKSTSADSAVPSTQPIVLRIDSKYHLYINSKEVSQTVCLLL